MTDNFIQLKKGNTLRLGIKDYEGNVLEGVLEFDFEDTGVLLRYQEMMERIKKDKKWLNNQYLIINKRQDVKGKKFLTKNEEDELKAEQEFFKRIAEDYNLFLGDNGVQKLLNGRRLGWLTLIEIDEIIKTQIEPHLKEYEKRVLENIKKKYVLSDNDNKEIEVLD